MPAVTSRTPHRRRRRRHRRRRRDDDPDAPGARASRSGTLAPAGERPERRPDRRRRRRRARRRRGDPRGLRGRRHRAVQRRRRHLQGPRARGGQARRHGHRQLVARGGWTRPSRSSSARSTRTTSAWHEGIIANPNCSTMQLVPVLMALRDAVGLERVVVDTYQAVSGTGGKAIKELQAQIEAHVGGRADRKRRLPAPDRVQRPARRSMSSSTTATPRRSGRSSPRAARSCTCRSCASRSTAVRVPGLRGAQRGRPRRDPRADHPGSRPDPVRGRARRRRPGRPGDVDVPARDRGRRLRRGLRRARPPGHHRSTTDAASRSGSSATTCARARRPTPSSSPRSSSSGAGSRRPRHGTRPERPA